MRITWVFLLPVISTTSSIIFHFLSVSIPQDGSIEFEEFIRALSITSRGNLDEKLHCKCRALKNLKGQFVLTSSDADFRVIGVLFLNIHSTISFFFSSNDDSLDVSCFCRPITTNHNYSYSGAFRLYDVDNDGYITRDEMYNIVDAIYQMVVSTLCRVRPFNMPSFQPSPPLPLFNGREWQSECTLIGQTIRGGVMKLGPALWPFI